MASLRAHLARLLVRWQVKRRLGDMADIAHVRRVFEATKLPPPAGVRFRPDRLGGVPGEWAESDTPARTTMLYLHGGGFIACSPLIYRPITGSFARRGFGVFAPDYRLAPEHPFPAAVEDAVAAWRALRAVTQGRMVVAGDSAGGTLTLAMMVALRDAGDRMPDAAAVFSPATDLAGGSASLRSNSGRDPMFHGEGLRHIANAYLHGADPRTPLASPLYADPAGLPPLLIHVGESEVLRDDSIRFADRARAAGVDVALRVWPVVPHAWQFGTDRLPEARQSLDAAAGFLHTR
ncbi:MAG TPA: alpha/beta hydrolase [Acetobacteraceae bacterium]|nr:alpha/beta hydrolase [Acetobacteraceae bacterium]